MTPRLGLMVRGIVGVAVLGIFILCAGSAYSGQVHAEAGRQPAFQSTDYPAQSTTNAQDNGYPADTTETPTSQSTSAVLPSATATFTPTPAVNVFRTEDTEMSGAKVTAPPSETPGPSLTAYYTPTATKTPPSTATVTNVPKKQAGLGASLDWGMFWIGFSIPVLAICGAVLYLLDRRPSFFKRTR
jgi:hypothetical protein